MVGSLGGVVWDRFLRKEPKGLGIRIIQFVAVCQVVPAVVLLSIADKLPQGAGATLLGAVVGYALSNLSDNSKKQEP